MPRLVVAVGLDTAVTYESASERARAGQQGARRRAGRRHGHRRPVLGRADPQLRREDHRGHLPDHPEQRTRLGRDEQLVKRLRDSLATATDGTSMQAHVGGSTATLIDLTHLVTQYLPLRHRSGRARCVHPADAGVPLDPRAAEGGAHEPALDRRRLRRGRRGVPVGLGAPRCVGSGETIPIVSFVPLVMFVILFGLSMDYEVFL